MNEAVERLIRFGNQAELERLDNIIFPYDVCSCVIEGITSDSELNCYCGGRKYDFTQPQLGIDWWDISAISQIPILGCRSLLSLNWFFNLLGWYL
jgi:hypothetical protein